MHFNFAITKALAFLTTLTFALSASLLVISRENGSIANVQPVTFRGEVDGRPYELNGTAEQVWAQLKEHHPEIQFKERDLTTRATLNKVQPPICWPVPGWDWGLAGAGAIEDGVKYLETLNARLKMDANACGRISCSYNSAIWLCNDNPYLIYPASPYLASYAQDLLNYCSNFNEEPKMQKVGGQEFDTDNYNIIVRADSC